jgi:hypothetical protein
MALLEEGSAPHPSPHSSVVGRSGIDGGGGYRDEGGRGGGIGGGGGGGSGGGGGIVSVCFCVGIGVMLPQQFRV